MILVVAGALACACAPKPDAGTTGAEASTTVPAQQLLQNITPHADERHFTNMRMLTNGGENAEAYFSYDASRLIFQATRPGVNACDQIFTMDADGSNVRMVSSGKGRTTCAYFFPSGDRIIYSSTHETAPECPAPPDMRQGYVWALYPYNIYSARDDGSDVRLLAGSDGYDAEATISPDGRSIVFTSTRDGDLDIYVMDADGANVRRLTDEPGYDGGAFFSWDGTKIIYRASRPQTDEELADYRRLLAQNLVRPSRLDIYIMNADGTDKRRLTDNGAANFAPFMHPDGRRVIFSSNMDDPAGRNFDLYLVNVDGSGLERVTTDPDFDGFPMFSRDGRQLVFASNRQHARDGDTNVFIVDWVD